MTRKTKRLLRNGSSAAVIAALGGAAVGLWFGLPLWFFMVVYLILMIGLATYPSRSCHHTSNHHLDMMKSIEDEP